MFVNHEDMVKVQFIGYTFCLVDKNIVNNRKQYLASSFILFLFGNIGDKYAR